MGEEHQGRSAYHRYGRPVLFGAIGLLVVGVLGYLMYIEFNPIRKATTSLVSIQNETPEPSNPISTEQRREYTVPADHPRYLTIGKLSISARILSMGVTKNGALDAPKTSWDVGWYAESARPGYGNTSALLIDGHVNDTRNTLGVFGHLQNLAQGDLIGVERGDGQQFTYRVVRSEQVAVENVDMTKMLQPVTSGRQGLNLITCGGIYDSKNQTFSDRVLVFAEQV